MVDTLCAGHDVWRTYWRVAGLHLGAGRGQHRGRLRRQRPHRARVPARPVRRPPTTAVTRRASVAMLCPPLRVGPACRRRLLFVRLIGLPRCGERTRGSGGPGRSVAGDRGVRCAPTRWTHVHARATGDPCDHRGRQTSRPVNLRFLRGFSVGSLGYASSADGAAEVVRSRSPSGQSQRATLQTRSDQGG